MKQFQITVAGLWAAAIGTCITIIFSTHSLNTGEYWAPIWSALYAGLHRTAWSMSIGWIILACCTGYGGMFLFENTFIIYYNLGPVNTFLTWGFFAPLSKLSYNIYLMHFLVIWTRYAYFRQRLPFSHYTMVSLT